MATDDTPGGSGATPYPPPQPAPGWGPPPGGGSSPPPGAPAQPEAWGQGNAAPQWGQGPEYGAPEYRAPDHWGTSYPGSGYPPATVPTGGRGMAVAALVLGIIALLTSITVVGGVLLGILAVIFGVIGLRRARRGVAGGRGMAVAGIVTGGLGLLLSLALIVLGVSILNSTTGKDLQSCLRSAGSNQGQIQACESRYAHQIGG